MNFIYFRIIIQCYAMIDLIINIAHSSLYSRVNDFALHLEGSFMHNITL